MKDQDMNIVSIHGVPRSGTSWLGQILNSHPDVAYRFQPLFAYRFKNRITLDSTKQNIIKFFDELYTLTDDDFILDKRPELQAYMHIFKKSPNPQYMVMKMVRYHHLIINFLNLIEDIKIIGIVRNPCGVINSWLNAPKEFKNGWSPSDEWRFANQKNQGKIEEFNGFEKWKEVALKFLEF